MNEALADASTRFTVSFEAMESLRDLRRQALLMMDPVQRAHAEALQIRVDLASGAIGESFFFTDE